MAALSLNAQQLDEVVAAYVEWHKHAECVQSSYSIWSGAARIEKPRRYAAYLEELDREQRACRRMPRPSRERRQARGAMSTRPRRCDAAPDTEDALTRVLGRFAGANLRESVTDRVLNHSSAT